LLWYTLNIDNYYNLQNMFFFKNSHDMLFDYKQQTDYFITILHKIDDNNYFQKFHSYPSYLKIIKTFILNKLIAF
jgi:predicted esterase YcpF (UPF0227 family)